jgi:hypothetical protein
MGTIRPLLIVYAFKLVMFASDRWAPHLILSNKQKGSDPFLADVVLGLVLKYIIQWPLTKKAFLLIYQKYWTRNIDEMGKRRIGYKRKSVLNIDISEKNQDRGTVICPFLMMYSKAPPIAVFVSKQF